MAKKGNIFDRIGDIMSSNIHALLDKCEDPEKMLDQNMRDAAEDLAELKESAKQLKADVTGAQRAYDGAVARMQAEHQYAVNAMKAGDEATAAQFLASEARIKEQVSQMKDPSSGYSESFSRYAEKAQRMLDEANAGIELDEQSGDGLDAMRAKYASPAAGPDMSDAMAALRAECGMGDN